jgi:hypothetical protein
MEYYMGKEYMCKPFIVKKDDTSLDYLDSLMKYVVSHSKREENKIYLNGCITMDRYEPTPEQIFEFMTYHRVTECRYHIDDNVFTNNEMVDYIRKNFDSLWLRYEDNKE